MKKNKLIEELRKFHTDLFILRSKAPLRWIERDIQEIMIKINAVIETLEGLKENEIS